jgi:hypothetical protein
MTSRSRSFPPRFSLIVSLSLSCSSLSAAADIAVTKIELLTTPQRNILITQAQQELDGTYFLAGTDAEKRPWFLKLSNERKELWQDVLVDTWKGTRVDFAFSEVNGGYGLVGSRRTKDITDDLRQRPSDWATITQSATQEFVSILNANGSIGAPIPVSAPGETRYLSCGDQVTGGFILAGAVPMGPEPWAPLVPWIEKVDANGVRLWASSFPMDQESIMEMRPQDLPKYCRAIRVSKNGSITLAMNVLVSNAARTAEERTHEAESWSLSNLATVILQLDAQGKEMGRVVHRSATDEFLFDGGNSQLVLVERYLPRNLSQLKKLPLVAAVSGMMMEFETNAGLRITAYDESLHEKSVKGYRAKGLSEDIHSVAHTPDGGYLIAGCVRDGAQNFVIYIAPSGRVSTPRKISAGGVQQCGYFKFGLAAEPNKATLVVSNEIAGNRLLTLKYSD